MSHMSLLLPLSSSSPSLSSFPSDILHILCTSLGDPCASLWTARPCGLLPWVVPEDFSLGWCLWTHAPKFSLFVAHWHVKCNICRYLQFFGASRCTMSLFASTSKRTIDAICSTLAHQDAQSLFDALWDIKRRPCHYLCQMTPNEVANISRNVETTAAWKAGTRRTR